MIKQFLIAGLLCVCAGQGSAAVLSFDDIPGATQNGYGPVGSYAGYVFASTGDVSRMDWIDTVTANEFLNRGAVSGDFTLINNFGGAAIIKRDGGGQFAFGGLWAENWLVWDTSQGSIDGYRGGSLAWSLPVALAGTFSYFGGQVGNIDELRLNLGDFFLVDDLELNDPANPVPAPGLPALMGIGLGALTLARRHSKRV